MKLEQIWSKYIQKTQANKNVKEKIKPFKSLVNELSILSMDILSKYSDLCDPRSDTDDYNKNCSLSNLINQLRSLKKNWKNVEIQEIFKNDSDFRDKFVDLTNLLEQIQLKMIPFHQKRHFIGYGLDKEISDFKKIFTNNLKSRHDPQSIDELVSLNTRLENDLKPILDKLNSQSKRKLNQSKIPNHHFEKTHTGLKDLNKFLLKFTKEDQKIQYQDLLTLAKFNIYINTTLESIEDKKMINTLLNQMDLILEQLNELEKTSQCSAVKDLKNTFSAYLFRNDSFYNQRVSPNNKIKNWKEKNGFVA